MGITITKHSCEYCANGYRTDFMGIDHHGRNDQEATACDNGTTPCPDHRCYYTPPVSMAQVRTPERTTNENATTSSHHVLADYERRTIAGLLQDDRLSYIGGWLAAVLDDRAAEITITVTRED